MNILSYWHICSDQYRLQYGSGKIFHNIDVREHGSGNAGTTNIIRVLGWKTGIPVLIIDLGKDAWQQCCLYSLMPQTPEALLK